jgi:hypothetical protein
LVAFHNLLGYPELELGLLRNTDRLLTFLQITAGVVLFNKAIAAASITIFIVVIITLFDSLAFAVATDLGLADQ